ncbi:MAG TPA: NAD(P)H-dependent oxidoreductase [Rhodothermales bacterium]|nr:NAD(P)H-dependent oxidoreductase [Rhodothermales bacterium]
MRVVAILGSARSDGDAARLLNAVLAGRPARCFDLAVLNIRDYEYDRDPAGDDFLIVAEAMTEADAVLFVSPVYWYAMSGTLKRFFDRLTDLITLRKPLGRRLAGRTMWLAACGTDPALPEGFEVPFRETAAYFDMAYGGAHYAAIRKGGLLSPAQVSEAAAFGGQILGRPARRRPAARPSE